MEKRSKCSLSPHVAKGAQGFYDSVTASLRKVGRDKAPFEAVYADYLELLAKQEAEPFLFEPYHERVLAPYNYYQFGLDFFRPLFDKENSTILGVDNLHKIEKQLAAGENAIFFANHQSEADPQAFSLLLEDEFPKLAENKIFVAGERVLYDPIAAPFSMGVNLLCIYSKRHMHTDRRDKQLHNSRTMKVMGELLSKGGHCIYVAPSGGRDRPDESGQVQLAPFDPQSVEMFALIARHAKKKSHFYPLALSTYDLLPPPKTVRKELGEERITSYTPLHMAVGDEIDLAAIPGQEPKDKHLSRKVRAAYIYERVVTDYNRLP